MGSNPTTSTDHSAQTSFNITIEEVTSLARHAHDTVATTQEEDTFTVVVVV